MMPASKFVKWLRISAGAVLAILLALPSLAWWYMSTGVFATDSFDKAAWSAIPRGDEDFTCYRGGMAEDIRDNVLSHRMTGDDVIALLGRPDGNLAAREYQYVLGMCRGFGFDYDNLHVYFDEHGHFSHAEIMQH